MIYPSFHQFLIWAKKYTAVPIVKELPANTADSESFFNLFTHYSKNEQTFFLDSTDAHQHGSYFYFPFSPARTQFTAHRLQEFPKIWESFKQYFNSTRGPVLPNSLPPFYGGAVGILSYDCGRYFENGWDTPPPPDPLAFPLMTFGIYDDLVCFDAKRKKIFLTTVLHLKGSESLAEKRRLYERAKRKVDSVKMPVYFSPAPVPATIPPRRERVHPPPPDRVGEIQFLQSVRCIQKYIAAGDIYQANLSQRIESGFTDNALQFYSHLRRINPSPYSCFFRLPNFELSSCSPELLLKKRGITVETRPIAGTCPRGKDQISDQKLAGELLLSAKERAEHVMLLDLERNDLGRVCRSGSVQVTEKMTVEKYSHVMHIVSHVAGKLKKSESIFSALETVFPGGTITGCPKVRCMQILDKLEPVRRGPFFGSAGWIGYQQDAEFNLLIRSAVITSQSPRKIYIQSGSGVVADSVPKAEYQESLYKARALLHALTLST